MDNEIKQLSLSEYLGKQIRSLMNEHTDHIATGNVKDFSEYKRICGVIEGLALAEREMLDWIERHTQT